MVKSRANRLRNRLQRQTLALRQDTIRAFSLVELLAIMAILVLLLAITVPAVNSIAAGSSLAQGGQDVADTIALARQEAVTRNRTVEVRFIAAPRIGEGDGDGGYFWGMQSWITEPEEEPLGRRIALPDDVVIPDSAELSPLLQTADTGSMDIGSGNTRDYRVLRIRPNGAVSGAPAAGTSFLTVVNERHANGTNDGPAPDNYSVITVNPVTGSVGVLRP